MNLIEKLGLEKCRAIVNGAPEGAQLFKIHFNLVGFAKLESHFVYMAVTIWKCGFNEKPVWKIMGCRSVLRFKPSRFGSVKDLRTAIANHERTDHCSDIKNHISPNTKVIER